MRALADLLYPELCVGCGRRALGGLCAGCAAGLRRIGPKTCRRCGAPAPARPDRCRECRPRAPFDRARQAVEFGPVVRSAIHRLKYRSERALAESLGALVVELVERSAGEELALTSPGRGLAATWVPTTDGRLRRRGYDHGRLLAECVAGALSWPALPLLVRTRDTPPQAGLEPRVRRSNLVGSLAAAASPLPPTVVVVDDVYTTGATASEAARALKSGGARRVVVLGLARALRPV